MFGGSIFTASPDSGAATTVLDQSKPGIPVAYSAAWGPGGTIYFASVDVDDNNSFWSVVPGGIPRKMVSFGPALPRAYRPWLVIHGNNFYFSTEDRQSDIWVMALKQP